MRWCGLATKILCFLGKEVPYICFRPFCLWPLWGVPLTLPRGGRGHLASSSCMVREAPSPHFGKYCVIFSLAKQGGWLAPTSKCWLCFVGFLRAIAKAFPFHSNPCCPWSSCGTSWRNRRMGWWVGRRFSSASPPGFLTAPSVPYSVWLKSPVIQSSPPHCFWTSLYCLRTWCIWPQRGD